jgi:hypothetical protein
MMGKVYEAVQACHRAGLKGRDRIRVYVLLGHKDEPEDALERLEAVRSWGHWPIPMRFQPLDAVKKNDYVAPGWTDRKLKDVMRYYSRLQYFPDISFDEYEAGKSPSPTI